MVFIPIHVILLILISMLLRGRDLVQRRNVRTRLLKEIMVQMVIGLFVNDRAMLEIMMKVLPARTYTDKHMINNVRIRARKKKLELDILNIVIEPKHFDTILIIDFKVMANNYTEGKFKLIHYYIFIDFSYLIP